MRCIVLVCFFFQAEDGIRDGHVTGVQTCALPILEAGRRWLAEQPAGSVAELDLSGVHRCDSAALVLLVDWLRTARSRGGELSLRALPEALRAMLPLLGLAGLLGEAGETEAATSCTMTGSTAH